MGGGEIFNVKIIHTLPKHLSLMISFNSEAQSSVQSTKPLFQEMRNILIH